MKKIAGGCREMISEEVWDKFLGFYWTKNGCIEFGMGFGVFYRFWTKGVQQGLGIRGEKSGPVKKNFNWWKRCKNV